MKYFIIAGNTRVGSTWVQSSLNSLPGVLSLREIRWKMPYAESLYPVHTYIDESTHSFPAMIEAGLKDPLKDNQKISVMGSKLKFDPYGFVPPRFFKKLGFLIDDNVFVTFLRRPYIEIFQTWKLYGIRHLANLDTEQLHKQNAKLFRSTAEYENICQFYNTHKTTLSAEKISLLKSSQDAVNQKNKEIEQVYPIEEAINDFLVLFYNDLLVFESLKHLRHFRCVNYASIEESFHDITSELLPDIAEGTSINTIRGAPTRKIETNDYDLDKMSNNALREISDYLFSLCSEVIYEQKTSERIINFDETSKSVSFYGGKFLKFVKDIKRQKICAQTIFLGQNISLKLTVTNIGGFHGLFFYRTMCSKI